MTVKQSFLVVDASRTNGQVVLVTLEDSTASRTDVIAEQVAFFSVNERGFFVCRSAKNGWWSGNVLELKRRTTLAGLPPAAEEILVSPDGRRLLWLAASEGESRLMLRDLETTAEHELIRGPGQITRPSWAPSSLEIAYYFVGAGRLVSGSFELRVAERSGNEGAWHANQVAPPSHLTGLTASRPVAPRWSPDGQRLLFTANYEGDELLRAYMYVTNKDGAGLTRVEGSHWCSDGAALLVARRLSLTAKDFVLSRYDLGSSKVIDLELPLQLPPSAGNGQWHPDGTLFAYVRNDNRLAVIDVSGKSQRELMDVDEYAVLTWVTR